MYDRVGIDEGGKEATIELGSTYKTVAREPACLGVEICGPLFDTTPIIVRLF